jgi:catalase
MRKHVTSAAVAALFLSLTATPSALAQDVPTQIVDAMNQLFGKHPGIRANHAKGVVVEGHFQASADAKALSKAAIFDGSVVPVVVRFSDATGVPDIPDGSPNANPHGMAIKFKPAAGGETDMVVNSLKFFPVATGEDFRDLLLANVASGPDAKKPTAVDTFLAAHPQVGKAFATVGTPASFADEHYYGIDAFFFVNAAGQRQAVRYQVLPEKLKHLKPEEAAKKPKDFLVEELPARVAKKPVVFHLKAQLANAGDQTKDPSQPWPDDRKVVDLGTITLDKTVADTHAAEKPLLFLPTKLMDGIELGDDPLPGVRAAAYAVSFGRRQ